MLNNEYDVIVIGGGPAGLASAIKADKMGLNVLVIENKDQIGGIPLQCVHPGFGLHYFREDLTGTEFIHRFIRKVHEREISCYTSAHVAEIRQVSDLEKKIKVINSQGVFEISTTTIIYTTGARERHRFETGITGKRVAGVYTAGEAQSMMDLYGIMPGKKIVIVGSGDVGLIMARRFALEGADVKAVIEMLPYPGGLTRNVVQCLEDFNIPLRLSHVVTRIEGDKQVQRVRVSKVNDDLKPLPNTEKRIPCDTVITAVGLVPYIPKLKRMGAAIDPATQGPIVTENLEAKTIPGVFVAGNSLLINDLVDYVVEQGEKAAKGAKQFIQHQGTPTKRWKPVKTGRNIRLVAPQFISGQQEVTVYARVQKPEEHVRVGFREITKEKEITSVTPAEMLRFHLNAGELTTVEKKLTLEVRSNE